MTLETWRFGVKEKKIGGQTQMMTTLSIDGKISLLGKDNSGR